MTACQRCGRENQEHYKFCLGCGAELPRSEGGAPKDFKVPTPPSFKAPSIASGPRPSQAPRQSVKAAKVVSAAPAGEPTVPCPSCGAAVPKSFRFCGGCGHAMPMGSAPVQAAARSAAPRQKLPSLILIQADGTDGETFTIEKESVTVGRNTSPLFASDSFLSPKHATFKWYQDTLSVTDEGSLNGVYLRIPPNVPIELIEGAMFRIGQEIVRAEFIPAVSGNTDGVEIMGSPARGIIARIATLVGQDTIGDAFPVPTAGLHLGRERGDVLFPDDGYVSGLHCRIHQERGKLMLTDVGSSNGTYLRLPSHRAVTLSSGDLLLVGQQLFRVQF